MIHSLGSRWKGSAFPIRILGNSGWAGFSKSFRSRGTPHEPSRDRASLRSSRSPCSRGIDGGEGGEHLTRGGRQPTRRRTAPRVAPQYEDVDRRSHDHHFRPGLLVLNEGLLLRPFGGPLGCALSHDLASVGGRAGQLVLLRSRHLRGLALRGRLRRVFDGLEKNAPRRRPIAEPKSAVGRLPLADCLGMDDGRRAEEARTND